MDELLMRVMGTAFIALSTALSVEQRRQATDMLLEMADRETTPYPDAQILRVIAQSAQNQESHTNNQPPSPSRPQLRVVTA
jgi:hypothetical protein